ncbi:MAG: preprotein translocase subunit YajC [Sulfuritalea sp.]|nr:preprotein translocase subunit YajC [Sulfuritalea sp.]
MLISNAYAQAAGAASDPMGGLMGMLPILLMFVVLWFVMIRPQMKKAKEQQKMVSELAKGDEVVTQGGIAGRIAKVGENYLSLEVAEGNAQGHAEESLKGQEPGQALRPFLPSPFPLSIE